VNNKVRSQAAYKSKKDGVLLFQKTGEAMKVYLINVFLYMNPCLWNNREIPDFDSLKTL